MLAMRTCWEPVSGQAARVTYDVTLADWQKAGLRLPSVVQVEKLASIEKSTVLRRLGKVTTNDWGLGGAQAEYEEALRGNSKRMNFDLW